jgi:DNA-binding protein HU-beta
MGKSELFSHFADRFEVKRTQAREFFDELTVLAERELKRSGEFVLPGMVKLVVQKRKARMGRNPATGEAIKIPAKTVVKARIAKQLKDAVLPEVGGTYQPRAARPQMVPQHCPPAAPGAACCVLQRETVASFAFGF